MSCSLLQVEGLAPNWSLLIISVALQYLIQCGPKHYLIISRGTSDREK